MSTDELTANADTAVIVPMFNEAAVVVDVVTGLRRHFGRIICVDDGSHDKGADLAQAAGATVVRHPANLGQGAAIETGIQFALLDPGIEYVVTFDADGQHRPQDALAMVVRARESGAQVVLGSRFLTAHNEVPAGRRALLKAATGFTRWTTGIELTDSHNGLRVLHRDAAQLVTLRLHGMSHASELLTLIARGGFHVVEHPVHVAYTEYSRAKGQRSWNALNILFEVAANRLRPAS